MTTCECCGSNGECATYDAFGRMVEFSKNSAYTENWYTQAGTVVMSGTTLAHAYLGSPGGGTFLEFGGTSDYLHKDWLGNARLASLISDRTVSADMAYAPYGEVYNFIQGSSSDWMFTGDVTQLDSEYLFDTPNRELVAANQGRWLSPDPSGAGWNQYAYVTDPLISIDPSGLACYPLEKYVFGSCAGFLNNGVNFGGSWSEFTPITLAPSNATYDWPMCVNCTFAWWGLFNGGFGSAICCGGSLEISGTSGPDKTSTTCSGSGRGLSGNTNLAGQQGGIPGQTVQPGTAAVIPQQFGVPNGAALAPYASDISGTIGDASFSAVTDVIGGQSPIPGMNVRSALQQMFPGQLVLEIPGAQDQGANAPVTISVPSGLNCPTGTSASPTGGG